MERLPEKVLKRLVKASKNLPYSEPEYFDGDNSIRVRSGKVTYDKYSGKLCITSEQTGKVIEA